LKYFLLDRPEKVIEIMKSKKRHGKGIVANTYKYNISKYDNRNGSTVSSSFNVEE
jgi:hypothetical protein